MTTRQSKLGDSIFILNAKELLKMGVDAMTIVIRRNGELYGVKLEKIEEPEGLKSLMNNPLVEVLEIKTGEGGSIHTLKKERYGA